MVFAGVALAPNYLDNIIWLKVVLFIATELQHHLLPSCHRIINNF
jgi:hypothetical protein